MQVFFKRRFYYQAHTTFVRSAPETVTESRWHQPWSEPVRRKPYYFKLQYNIGPTIQPFVPDFGWFFALSKHPGPKKGLLRDLQLSFSGPPRHLPNPNVTGTMSATEINTDEFLGAIDVFVNLPPVRAKVSIIEIPIEDSAAASIAES